MKNIILSTIALVGLGVSALPAQEARQQDRDRDQERAFPRREAPAQEGRRQQPLPGRGEIVARLRERLGPERFAQLERWLREGDDRQGGRDRVPAGRAEADRTSQGRRGAVSRRGEPRRPGLLQRLRGFILRAQALRGPGGVRGLPARGAQRGPAGRGGFRGMRGLPGPRGHAGIGGRARSGAWWGLLGPRTQAGMRGLPGRGAQGGPALRGRFGGRMRPDAPAPEGEGRRDGPRQRRAM